jgi:hypothetical protein
MFWEQLDLPVIWYFLVGILLSGYAVLDGFDLGVGILHLFTRGDEERQLMINSIGPVWDGNEVWLVTAGGALFAAFPDVYATVFSGFYLPFMLLLVALIFRAVAIEFRGKQPMRWWRTFWDWGFALGSLVSTVLMGIALGNVALGIPLGADMEYQGGFFNLLNRHCLVCNQLFYHHHRDTVIRPPFDRSCSPAPFDAGFGRVHGAMPGQRAPVYELLQGWLGFCEFLPGDFKRDGVVWAGNVPESGECRKLFT